MDLGITGRTALVLGGSGGIGGGVAKSLGREGVNVAVAGRNLDKAQAVASEIVAGGGCAIALAWDLADLDAIDRAVSEVEQKLGRIDILFNNTGGPPPTPVADQPAEVWRRHFESMVLSVITLTDRVLPHMKAQRWGRIITSTSAGVISPIPNLGLSNALRVSLVGWSKTLAREIGAHGITSNVVVPGRIHTPRIDFLDAKTAEREGRDLKDVVADSLAAIPAGRYGTPGEYGDVVAFLASACAAYVTGSVIRVDGGLIANV